MTAPTQQKVIQQFDFLAKRIADDFSRLRELVVNALSATENQTRDLPPDSRFRQTNTVVNRAKSSAFTLDPSAEKVAGQ